MAAPPPPLPLRLPPRICSVCSNLDLELMRARKVYRSRPFKALLVTARGCGVCSVLLEGVRMWADLLGLALEIEEPAEVAFSLFLEGSHFVTVEIINRAGDWTVFSLDFYNHHGKSGPWSNLKSTVHMAAQERRSIDSTVDWISQQVRRCEDSHPGCRVYRQLNPPLPTRILDLGTGPDRDGAPVQLVETCGRRGVYATLSHCWGDYQPLTTTRQNLETFKSGIDVELLPKTFRDAVEVVRKLGLQYLWIDSLCIIQGDMADWEVESSKMTAVYSNGYLNLAATSSKDCRGGLLAKNKPRYIKLERPGAGSSIDTAFVRVGLDTGHRQNVSFMTPVLHHYLLHRAWVYQEHVLSRRFVQFTASELIFDCHTSITCECGNPLERYGGDKIHQYRPNLRNFKDKNASDGDVSFFNRWSIVLGYYTKMLLTQREDRLPALSGIAGTFAERSLQSYFAGMWTEQMPQSLMWSCSKPERPRDVAKPAPLAYVAPSWSWASVESSVYAGGWGDNWTAEPECRVLGIWCQVAGENPYGRVKAGHLNLSGRFVKHGVVIPLIEEADKVPETSQLLFEDIGVLFDVKDIRPDRFEVGFGQVTASEVQSWTLVVVGFYRNFSKTIGTTLLVLKPSPTKNGAYMRVGVLKDETPMKVLEIFTKLPVGTFHIL